jgi:hypothetical protein
MHFVEVAAAISIARRADPWAGPGVHLADPDPETVKSQVVEDAVSRLAEARGRKVPAPLAVAVETEEPIHQPLMESSPDSHLVESSTPIAPSRVREPKDAVAPVAINTEFPEEGVMIGGATPRQAIPETDPWAPKPKEVVVQRGARIRMES